VLRSGQPVLLDENAPQKIKTSYLVHSLVYVPLQLKDHVFGVLGVDNRHSHVPFNEHHVKLLSALAEYAVVAIQNAGLYQSVNAERNKFETVLARIHDGVIVMDHDRRILLVNQEASQALGLQESQWSNRLIQDIITQSELIDLVNSAGHSLSDRTEVSLEDGRVFSAMLAPIPEVGMAITLHDITNLKKLDRIKSDFVNTVSHDLRSPLTAILGYAELVERAGPVNDLQRDFIQRVQVSVHNITMLVDDLLNLGRIEAGFDSRNEKVVLPQIVEFSAEGFQKSLHDKDVQLQVQLPADFPVLYGNPVQLRQMVDNLLDNAIKYTPRGGQIRIQGTREENQIILQFSDTGMGIPTLDLPYIFDKFYRASNASAEVTGSGLGLSIVRSIVENHQGRIWVNSTVNAGTTFTVVLPLPEQ
jgi:two-component system NtrC family sensor kinase